MSRSWDLATAHLEEALYTSCITGDAIIPETLNPNPESPIPLNEAIYRKL